MLAPNAPELRRDDLKVHRSLLEGGQGDTQPEKEQREGAAGGLRSGSASLPVNQGKSAYGHAETAHAEESIRSMIAGMKESSAPVARLGAWAIFFLAWYSMKTMMGTTSQPCS